jgi:hypothetical protein
MNIKKSKNKRLNYACGMNPSQTRKMCLFIFKEFFYNVEVDIEERCYNILVHKVVNGVTFVEEFGQEFIDFFKDYWSEITGFKLKYYIGLEIESL